MSKTFETNVIYCGDCKDVLKKIPDESVDLIYLDPPFFSQKHYENFWIKGDKDTKLEFSDKDWEKLRSSIDPNILREYEHIEERWKGGHKGLYVYIAYMRERLIQCERVLKLTGSVYLHCDSHAGHYLKVMMDELFGYGNFQNEIVWQRTFAHGGGTAGFSRIHDVVLFYVKSEQFTFNRQHVPYSEAYVEGFFRFKELDGRRYQLVIATGSGETKTDYTWKGIKPTRGRHWAYSKEKMEELEKEGRLGYSQNGMPRIKQYLDDKEGTLVTDLWLDVPVIHSQSKERLGYPTQKPEALLERIIKVSSNERDLILDAFCGCGTTLAVAKRLNRRFIGIDLSRVACDVMNKRLGGNIRIIGGETQEELSRMEPHEFARLVIVEKMGGIVNPKKSGDMGVDGWIEFKTIPVQVKRWAHKVGRPELDKFKTAIEREKKTSGIIVANDFSGDCYEEAARIEKESQMHIALQRVADILEGKRVAA